MHPSILRRLRKTYEYGVCVSILLIQGTDRDLSEKLGGDTQVATKLQAKLLALSLLNNLIGHGLRHLGVRVEDHREHGTTTGLRPEVADVPEHF